MSEKLSLLRALSRALVASIALMALAVVAGPAPSSAEDSPGLAAAPPPTPSSETGTPEAAKGAAGLKVNVDPKTGRFLDTPAAESGAAPPQGESAQPLVEVPSQVPGGGVGIRITDQRFNTAMHASTGPDGSAHTHCDEPAK
jgi:hypothetical protein